MTRVGSQRHKKMYISLYHLSVQLLHEVKLRKMRHRISFAFSYVNESVMFCPHPSNSSNLVKYGADYIYLPN